MMSKALKNFYDALQRLVDGKPNIVRGVYSINNDTVALEAGRKRGTIKKSRPELAELIVDIMEVEAIRTGKKSNSGSANIQDVKLEKAQNRIVELEKKLAELEEKYKKQMSQLNIQMFKNMELHAKVQSTKKKECSLLDFIKS